jgi:hypothetical protein
MAKSFTNQHAYAAVFAQRRNFRGAAASFVPTSDLGLAAQVTGGWAHDGVWAKDFYWATDLGFVE